MKLGSALFSLITGAALMLGCGGAHRGAGPNFGVVAHNQGGISIIDPANQTAKAPVLLGELGSMGGGRFDVAIAPGGATTLVSNFGDSTVYFIDTRDTSNPVVVANINVGFFAEDIAITPNGKYALVTDGGSSSKVAVLDMTTRTLLNTYTAAAIVTDATTDPVTTYTPSFQAVSITPDGRTVLCADYFNACVVALTIDAAGNLTHGSYLQLIPDPIKTTQVFRPVNVAISPNGLYAVAAVTGYDDESSNKVMAFPSFRITSPGVIELASYNVTDRSLTAAQTLVFNRAGSKVYAYSVPVVPSPAPVPEPGDLIVELNVGSTGVLTDSGNTTELGFLGRSQLFGVDTMALDRSGRYLYVANMTVSGGRNLIQVLDLNNSGWVKTLSFDAIDIDADGTADVTLPVGICFAP